MIKITSSKNERLKHIKSLLQKKWRMEYSEFTCEGEKTVLEAYNNGAHIKTVVISEDYTLPVELSHFDDIIEVPNGIFTGLADTTSPQGILAVLEIPDRNDEIPTDGLLVYCDGVRDPGNLGTIIRTADAAGIIGVLLSSDCVDVFSPKVIRSTMGSFFHISIFTDIDYEGLKEVLDRSDRSLFGGVLSDKTIDYRVPHYTNSSVIAVGNEANGMRDDIISLCTPVKIPIYGKAESLNVSVAAALLMYEVANKCVQQ